MLGLRVCLRGALPDGGPGDVPVVHVPDGINGWEDGLLDFLAEVAGVAVDAVAERRRSCVLGDLGERCLFGASDVDQEVRLAAFASRRLERQAAVSAAQGVEVVDTGHSEEQENNRKRPLERREIRDIHWPWSELEPLLALDSIYILRRLAQTFVGYISSTPARR